MGLLPLLYLSIFFFVSFGYTKLDKLTANESLFILKMMDVIDNSNNDSHNQLLKSHIQNLTGLEYDPNLREKMYDILNPNYVSLPMKLAALISMQNIITVIMIFVAIAFFFSLGSVVYAIFAPFINFIIIKVLLNKYFWYTTSLSISIMLMLIDIDKITNNYIKMLYIFDWLTPLFGCLIFAIVTFAIAHVEFNQTNLFLSGLFITIIWFVDAIIQNNWLIGVATIMMLFITNGFLLGSIPGGYYSGFTDKESINRCLITSLLLNIIMIFTKIGFITGNFVKYAQIFETGIILWGTLVGSISMLVLSTISEYEMHATLEKNNFVKFILIHIITGLCYLGIIFVGNMLNISSYKSIGGTFLVLFGLDIERITLKKFSNGHYTIFLFIVLVNLYMIRHLIGLYPEYFIF